MKNFIYSKGLFLSLVLMLCAGISHAAIRTWTGAVNLDFNNSGNWSGAGAILTTDQLIYNGTANQTITLSASITIAGLSFKANSGAVMCRLDVGAHTLTINGQADFDAVQASNPMNYDLLYVNVNNGGNLIINGNCNFHMTGAGTSYLTTGNFATVGPATPGTVYFNGNLTVGNYGRTVGAYEPHMVFNGAGAQTAVFKCNGGAYMFKAQNLTFGTTNAPTVTLRGKGAVYFNTYDGNMAIGANTSVIVPDCTLVGYMTRLDRYNTGAGTFTMGAGSLLRTGCPNQLMPFNGANIINGFATYALDVTSTVTYNSTGYQGVYPCTYGNLVCSGSGNPGWKYSYGGSMTVAGNWTIQGSCIYGPYQSCNVTCNGNTLIQTAATLNATRDNAVPNQTYTLKGHYTNNAIFTSGTPAGVNLFLFNSATAGQNIGGTSVTTFYNLQTSNTSTGCTLTQNENVQNVWTLSNGAVFLNSMTMTVQNSLATAVVRTNGYAVSETSLATNPSKIVWQMGTTTGAHIFPYGVSGTYIPLTFNKTSATSATVTTATRATPASDNLPWASGVSHMYDPTLAGNGSVPAVVDRWWEFSSTAAITADVTFSYRGIENTLSAPYQTGNLGAQYWTAAWLPNNAAIGSAAAVTAGVGSVTASGLSIGTAYTPWVLSSTSAPLPIELTSFTVVCEGQNPLLHWETASELNNNYFTIERSINAVDYVEAGRVDGAGTSTQMHSYSWKDMNAAAVPMYYRLRQTDYNGMSTVTAPVYYVPCQETHMGFNAFSPNGTSLSINLSDDAASTYVLHITDATGRTVLEKQIVSEAGQTTLSFDNVFESTGIYFVTLISATGDVKTNKILLR